MSVFGLVQSMLRTATLGQAGIPDFTGRQLKTSAQCVPVPIVYGTRRVAPNSIWKSTLADTKSWVQFDGSGPLVRTLGPDATPPGDGTGSTYGYWLGELVISRPPLSQFLWKVYGSTDTQSSDSFSWHPEMLALCEGPINSVPRMWNGSGSAAVNFNTGTLVDYINDAWNPNFNPASVFYVVFLGTTSQTAWNFFSDTWVTSNSAGWYTNNDLAYRGIAYIASRFVNYGHGDSPPQQSFEVVRTPTFAFRALDSKSLGYDYSMSDIIPDILTNPQYGMGFTLADIDSASLLAFKQYLFAQGLYHSVLLTAQTSVVSLLDQWAIECNCWIFWSGTKIYFIPLGDESLTGNGLTYTPDTSPAYNITLNDLIVPISVQRADPIDCSNRVSIEISDRGNDYSKTPIEWKDANLIGQFGIRDASSVNCEDICDSLVGAKVVELLGKRLAYIRNLYSFTVSARFIRLLPGTIVTLTDPNLGILLLPVRVQTIEEADNGDLAIVAEEYPGTTGISRPSAVQGWSPTGGPTGGTSSGVGGPGFMPSPPPIVSSNTTIDDPTVIVLFQAVAGGYTITLGNVVAGKIYRFVHVNGAAGTNLLETTGQAVTLSRGANTFTIEDPQNRFAATANSVQFVTSEKTYEYWLDVPNNIFRCLGQVR